MRWIAAAAAALFLVLMMGGVWYWTRPGGDVFADCRSSAVAGGAGAIGGPFELVTNLSKTDGNVAETEPANTASCYRRTFAIPARL